MNKESLELIKEISRNDFILGSVVTIVLLPFFGGGAGLFLVGVACSLINFTINSYTNNKLIDSENILNVFLFLASYVFRIGVICSIAIFLITKEDLFFYFFIAGYSSQLISILVYGFKLKTREGI